MGLWDWLKRLMGGSTPDATGPPGAAEAPPTPAPRPPSRAQPAPPDPAPPPPALPARRYHLGLDWGTSSSKMVIRDYGAPGFARGLAYVIEPEGSLRYPSTVVLQDGRLWFGGEAERRRAEPGAKVWDSLKGAAGVGNGWEERVGVDDLRYRDLVTFSLAHMIAVGSRHAAQLAVGEGIA